MPEKKALQIDQLPLDSPSQHLDFDILQKISEVLNVEAADIINITPLLKGMTNRSFVISCRNSNYIIRIPGEGSDQFINRREEYQVYNTIQGKNICDDIIYLSPETGIKITRYIPEARSCDIHNQNEVKKCMQLLRRIHDKNFKVSHTFDLYKQIEYYESLLNGQSSCYKDYAETKNKIYELKDYINQQPKQWCLAHIDAVHDNFLFYTAENGTEELRLIDWEYAAMQDAHVDIAMFACYSLYNYDQIENLIEAYFPEGCPCNVKLKIYCYISICGLLWSNWCEFKRLKGMELGEYAHMQYHYAKSYYSIFKSSTPPPVQFTTLETLRLPQAD